MRVVVVYVVVDAFWSAVNVAMSFVTDRDTRRFVQLISPIFHHEPCTLHIGGLTPILRLMT